MLFLKNISGEDIYIDNLVQVDQDTPHADDGKILDGQTLDFSLSFRPLCTASNDKIDEMVNNGDLVFVVDGVEQTVPASIQLWGKGPFFWALKNSTFRNMIAATPEYQELIVTALQNISGDDRLDASAIKNLP